MSQKKTKPKIYLDSAIFIAWLTDEDRPGDDMHGVYECFARIEKGEILGIVASVIWTEVLLDRYEEEQAQRFRRLLSGRRVQEVGADSRVSRLAGELRHYYVEQDKRDNGGKLSTLDALHLTAAIHYQADAFYTFDDGKKEKSRSLLSISGKVGRHNLKVCKPPYTQMKLL